MQHVLDQNLLAGAVGATGVDDDWLPDTSKLQPEAMARQLHRTKWAFGLVSVTHLSARVSTGSLAGRFGEPGMCRWLRMSGWPTWLDGESRPQRSGVCGFWTIQLNLHAYLRYRVCGCRLIKLLFMHVVVLADEATVWFSVQFQLQPEFV